MGSSEDLVSDRAQVPLSSNVFHFWSISVPLVPLSWHFGLRFANETCKKELTVG